MVNSVFLRQSIEEFSLINRSNSIKALSSADVEKVKSTFAVLFQDPRSGFLSTEVAKLSERVKILHETNRLTLGRNTIGLVIDLFKKFELSLSFENISDKSKRQLVNWMHPLVNIDSNPAYKQSVLDLVLRAPIKERRERCSHLEALLNIVGDEKLDVVFRLKGVPEDDLSSCLEAMMGLVTYGCSARDVHLLLDFFDEIDFIDINLLSDCVKKMLRILTLDRFSYQKIGIKEKVPLMKALQFIETDRWDDVLTFVSLFKGNLDNVDQIVSLLRMKDYLDEGKEKKIIEFKDVVFPQLQTSEDKIGFILLFEYIPSSMCDEFFVFYIQYLQGIGSIEQPFTILERYLVTKGKNIIDFHNHLEKRIATFESPMFGLYFMRAIWENKEKFIILEDMPLYRILMLFNSGLNYLFSLSVGQAQDVFCCKYDLIVSFIEDEEGLKRICDQIDSFPFDQRGELLYLALVLSDYGMNALEFDELLEAIAGVPAQNRWVIARSCEKIINLSSQYQPKSILFVNLLTNDVDANELSRFTQNVIRVCQPLHPSNYFSVAKVLSLFSIKDQSLVCKEISHLMTINVGHYSPTWQRLLYDVSAKINIKEKLHSHLQLKLQQTSDVVKADALAKMVLDYVNYFRSPQDSALFILAFTIRNYSQQLGDLANPYRIYQDQKFFNRHIIPFVSHVTYFPIEGGTAYFDFSELSKSKESTIPYETVFSLMQSKLINNKVLKDLEKQFQARIAVLNQDEQNVILDYIRNSYSQDAALLLQNFKDPFLESLLTFRAGSPVPKLNAYFIAILYFILSKSSDLQNGNCLTDKEGTLFAISSSIQNCSTGKAEGIMTAYRYLPVEYKYLNEIQVSQIPSVDKICTWLHKVLKNYASYIISSESPMMREIIGTIDPIPQLSHHSLYLKNYLTILAGFDHEISFDIYTHTLSRSLLEKQAEELWTIFKKHFTPSICANVVKSEFCQVPSSEGLYQAINDLIQDRLPLSSIWDLDDETGEYALSKEGALQALLSAGLVKAANTDVAI